MGRKGNWFSSVRKALSPESKEKNGQEVSRSKKKWFGKKKQLRSDASAVAVPEPPPPQPAEGNLTCVVDEEGSHACTFTASPATEVPTALEAPVAAAEPAHEVARHITVTRFAGKSIEEVAAIKIQTAFRGFLARRALRALKGLVRLKTLMEGSVVKRQAANTLRCMQTLSRVHSQIRFRRVRLLEENQALQKELLQKRAKELESLRMGEEWDDSLQSKEQIEAGLLSKYEATLRRERALAYAYSHQQSGKNASKSVNPMFMNPNNPTWGWSWSERWMAAHPWEGRGMIEKDADKDRSSVKNASSGIYGGEISKAYAKYQLNSEVNSPTASQKGGPSTFQLPAAKPPSSAEAKKVKAPSPRSNLGPDDDSKSIASMQSERPRRNSTGGSSVRDDQSLSGSPAIPSYMVPTESAKAKSRMQSPMGATESIGTPPDHKGSPVLVKKRLSFPPSPAMARRLSGPPKMDSSFNADNGIANGVSA